MGGIVLVPDARSREADRETDVVLDERQGITWVYLGWAPARAEGETGLDKLYRSIRVNTEGAWGVYSVDPTALQAAADDEAWQSSVALGVEIEPVDIAADLAAVVPEEVYEGEVVEHAWVNSDCSGDSKLDTFVWDGESRYSSIANTDGELATVIVMGNGGSCKRHRRHHHRGKHE